MTTYELAEAIAEQLAKRDDIEDMAPPEGDADGDAPTAFFVNMDGLSFEVQVTQL